MNARTHTDTTHIRNNIHIYFTDALVGSERMSERVASSSKDRHCSSPSGSCERNNGSNGSMLGLVFVCKIRRIASRSISSV